MKPIFSAQQKRVLTMCVVMYTAAYVCRLNLSAALSSMLPSLDLSMARGGKLTRHLDARSIGQILHSLYDPQEPPQRYQQVSEHFKKLGTKRVKTEKKKK